MLCFLIISDNLRLKMFDLLPQWAFFGAVLFFLPTGFAATDAGSYECSPNQWTPGSKSTITFQIDRSKYPRLCVRGTSGRVDFLSSPDGTAAYAINCSVTTDIRTSCSFTSGALGCGCVNSNDNGSYVLEYNFIDDPSYNRWWRAEIGCLDSSRSPALSFSSINCDGVTRVYPTTTTTTTTTTAELHPDCDFWECDRDECTLCCTLHTLLIVLLIIIIPTIVVVIILYCCCREDVKTCAGEPGCRHCFCGALVALFVCMDKCSCNNGSTSAPLAGHREPKPDYEKPDGNRRR